MKKPYGAVAIKHKMVLKKMLEKGVSKEQAMKEVGYSDNYASHGNIIKSKTWPELMEEFLPDDLLSKVHREGLGATKSTKEFGEVEDYDARHKYLDSAYKLKKRYDNTITLKGGISQLSSREIEDAIAGEVSAALAALTGEE